MSPSSYFFMLMRSAIVIKLSFIKVSNYSKYLSHLLITGAFENILMFDLLDFGERNYFDCCSSTS